MKKIVNSKKQNLCINAYGQKIGGLLIYLYTHVCALACVYGHICLYTFMCMST